MQARNQADRRRLLYILISEKATMKAFGLGLQRGQKLDVFSRRIREQIRFRCQMFGNESYRSKGTLQSVDRQPYHGGALFNEWSTETDRARDLGGIASL
jgi:hypothetical protein